MSGKRNITGWMIVAGLLAGGAAVSRAQTPPPNLRKAPPPRPKDAPPPAASSPEQKLQDNWKAAATPGEEHKVLEGLVGKWKAHVVVRVNPNRVSEESDGTSEGTMLFGGRYVQLTHKGTLNGQPFEGMMLTGYDNVAKKYVSEWIDNMGTSFIHYDGTYDKRLKRLFMGARFLDPMTRQPLKVRAITTFVDASSWTYEEFSTPEGGKEWQSLKITFTKG